MPLQPLSVPDVASDMEALRSSPALATPNATSSEDQLAVAQLLQQADQL